MLGQSSLFVDLSEDIYFLMNKDEVLIKFKIVKDIAEYAEELKVYKRPFWIKDLYEFLNNRKAPAHRKHISELLEQCGCNTVKGYLDFTHALSLNDTLWVKKESEKDLEWSKVSLYRNEFDETIARIAFSGGMYGRKFSSLTPELGTSGQFAKCWIRESDKIYLIKQGTEGVGNSGLEPYSEYYGSNIMSNICDTVVSYDLASFKDKLVTKCNLFTSEDVGFIPTSYLDCNSYIASVLSLFKSYGMDTELKTMFVGDSVIMNEDRHMGNFGVLIDNNTFEIINFAPIFDHNISMLCYAIKEDLINPDKYMKEYNKGHRLTSGSFIELGKALASPLTKRKLRSLLDYKIKKHEKYNLDDWRLDILNNQVNRQIRGLLS